jgi:hypothetical protein
VFDDRRQTGQQVTLDYIREEQHKALQEGQRVEVTYSPHLHYVFSIQPIANETPLGNVKQEQAR